MNHVNVIVSTLSSKEFLVDSSNQRLQEMWCAARFSTGYEQHLEPCQVEIEDIDEQREYDFHLVVNGSRFPFQVFEVMEKGRLRDKDYKNLTKAEIEEKQKSKAPLAVEESIAQIENALKKKMAKHYAESLDLNTLVYININVLQLPWAPLRDMVQRLNPKFASVWMVTEHMFGCLLGGHDKLEGWMQIRDGS
tara:strand:- start:1123 stop:1701 length:579 start_codon:yes stop_codon:yes gene_type:complete